MIQTILEETVTATIILDRESRKDERLFVKDLKTEMKNRPELQRHAEFVKYRFGKIHESMQLEDGDIIDELNLFKDCYEISREVGLRNPFRDHRRHIEERFEQLARFAHES